MKQPPDFDLLISSVGPDSWPAELDDGLKEGGQIQICSLIKPSNGWAKLDGRHFLLMLVYCLGCLMQQLSFVDRT